MRDLLLLPGRFAGRSAGASVAALIALAIALGINQGWIGAESYPPQCESDHRDHATYVADHPGECP